MVDKQTIYEFSEFRVDIANKTLQKNGKTISLTPKVFDTLIILLENAGNLVGKDELMRLIWHDRFVEESNLTFNIKMLRKVLNDSASNPIFIETIPRRGYRFIDKVTKSQVEKVEPSEQKPASSRKFSTRSVAFLLILIGLVTTVFASWWWRNLNLVKATPIIAKEFGLNKISDTGKVFHAAISPDGQYLAYSNKINGKSSLWLRQLETGVNNEVIPPGNELYYGIKFSQDGKTIYFTRKTENETIGIYKISVFGGVPQKIISNSQGGLSISPDDKKIAFIRYEKGVHASNKLIIADTDGNNEQLIKETEQSSVFWFAEFSPDGKTIAASFGHTNNASQDISLVEINLENFEQRQISTTNFFNIHSIAWLPNKSGLILSANENISDPAKLWQVDYSNGNVEPLSKDSMSYSDVCLTKNADKMVAITVTADFQLFVSNIDKPDKSTELVQARDGFYFTNDYRIVFASDTSGSQEIWIMNIDGLNQRQLTNNKNFDAYPIVGADNRIYFTSNRTGQMQVWRMNLDGTEQTQITKYNGGFPLYISPDGNELYYQKTIDSSIWKLSLLSGEETLIIEKKTRPFVRFSPDGKNLAFITKNKEMGTYRIEIMDLATKQIIKTFLPPNEKQPPIYLNWLNDSNTITYAIDSTSDKTSLWIQKLDEPNPLLVTELGSEVIMDAKFFGDGKMFGFIRGNWKHDAVLINGTK